MSLELLFVLLPVLARATLNKIFLNLRELLLLTSDLINTFKKKMQCVLNEIQHSTHK